MAAEKKAPQKSKKQLKTNNVTGNKKVFALIIVAFAVVGVIALIRSFAATVVISLNPGDHLSDTTGLTSQNASVVVETATNGKKTNNVNLVEIKSSPTTQTGKLMWTYKPNTGDYQGCFTVKPSVANSSAQVYSYYQTPQNFHDLVNVKDSGFATASGVSVPLNQAKEVCTNFTVSEAQAGKDFSIVFATNSVNANSSTWRVSNLTIRLGAGNYASEL